MALTGGIKFFNKNKALAADGSSVVASSNTADQALLLGTNKFFKWQSIGSNDSTTETLTITLPAAVSISRIFLIQHNFKAFQIQYGASQDFTNVIGLDSYSDNKIDVSGNTRNAAYFEFDAVTTDTIIITADTALVTNAQKELVQAIITNELGTLVGFPGNKGAVLDRNRRSAKATSGRVHIEKGYENFSMTLKLKTYPGQADLDLLDSLHDINEPFLIYPCGGKPDQFRFTIRGFRDEDVFQVQTNGKVTNGFTNNIYVMGVDSSYNFVEVV